MLGHQLGNLGRQELTQGLAGITTGLDFMDDPLQDAGADFFRDAEGKHVKIGNQVFAKAGTQIFKCIHPVVADDTQLVFILDDGVADDIHRENRD